ncbi:MAG: peptidase MA family metallohydrolase [Dehalococcoidia bacterium]|nr:peptidase MA family metallohydrolase [Dehalococcoidia bacterium]
MKKAVLLLTGLVLVFGLMTGMVSSQPPGINYVGAGKGMDANSALFSASPINIISSNATPQFPNAIVFEVQADSIAPIIDARLHFYVERDSFVKVVTEEKLDFISSTRINASYTWDMRYTGGLPTGTTVIFWWTITDASGWQITSEQQKVNFNDTRYVWKSLQQDKITLYWYGASNSLAQRLLDTSILGLSSLEANTGASLSRRVSIYIYDDASDMRGAMLFAQEWTGGVAYTSYGTIVIGINDFNITWGERALVHELAHMVNYQMTNNPYNGMPVWLEEGLAMYAEGSLELSFQQALISALSGGNLFSVRSISSPFSTDASLSYQKYAQSYSLVDFLISQYGQAKMASLLEIFRQGCAYDDALQAVYGFNMDGLYQAWLAFAMQKYVRA